MVELFSNLASTTINQNGGIGATDTSVVVTGLNGSATWNSFPSSGNFRVIFGSDTSGEIALCTAVNTSTNTLTIVRGQEGSIAQAWINATPVTLVITAQSFNQARAELFQVGPYSAKPSTGLPTGSYYQAIDAHHPWIWDPTSGAWRPQINGVLGFQPPLSSSFTAFNQGSSTVTDQNGSIAVLGAADNGTTLRGYTVSQTNPAFVEASFTLLNSTANVAGGFAHILVCMRESATAKLYGVVLSLPNSSTGQASYLDVVTFSNNTTRASFSSFSHGAEGGAPIFLRIRKDNITVYADASRDRINWKQLASATIASTFTTAPDQVGFATFSEGSGLVTFGYLSHFAYGSSLSTTTQNPIITRQMLLPPPTAQIPPINGFVNTILNH